MVTEILPFNSASRIKNLIIDIHKNSYSRICEYWGDTFQLGNTLGASDANIKLSLLNSMKEVDRFSQDISKYNRNFPNDLCQRILMRLREIFNPDIRDLEVVEIKKLITPDLLYTLDSFIYMIPSDGRWLSPGDLIYIYNLISFLEDQIKTSTSQHEKSFLVDSIEIFMKLIVFYRINGNAAYNEYAMLAVEMIFVRKELLLEFKDNESIKCLKNIWRHFFYLVAEENKIIDTSEFFSKLSV